MSNAKFDPAERSLRARIASHAFHAQVPDIVAHLAPARRGFMDKFERQVDPDGVLDPAERTRRAEHARKAYMSSLALRSVQARRRNAGNYAEPASPPRRNQRSYRADQP